MILDIALSFLKDKLIIIICILSLLVAFFLWDHRVEQRGRKNAIKEVQIQNDQATRKARNAANNSGKPARVRSADGCPVGYRC